MNKNSNQIRQSFLDYFAKQGHSRQPSSSLIPDNDPTLLFTNAGMNQFKNVFLGHDKRDYKRAATSQKCLRAGGKHNDLENVGFTSRHHTFFEMLGNFSFGDYFKKEAIHFAWELITKEYGLDKNRLYVTVFESDDEAADIWHKQEGIPKDRIYRFGEKDNFWRMGDTGPCGPCSEIFYDQGPLVPGDPKENVMGGSGDRYMEIWNLVFMQYNESATGQTPLPNPSIDTGMGFERLTAVLQGEISNYHTDIFQDIIASAGRASGHTYVREATGEAEQVNVALRVLADHARATAFLMAEGILPSNEGRGYVLRRIMRRALRYGRKLAPDASVFPVAVNAVIEKMKSVYPELSAQTSLITSNVVDEEARFLSTLDQGTRILDEQLRGLATRGLKGLPGEEVFKLYDTFGFPLDLTRLMAAEKGFTIDEAGFERNMEAARAKAKASWKGKGITEDAGHLISWAQAAGPVAGFVGYEQTDVRDVRLMALSDAKANVEQLKSGQTGYLIFERTPFYGESGGQVGDAGEVKSPSGQAEVLDVQATAGQVVHHVRVTDGELRRDQLCYLQVLDSHRRRTAANHSATHLLHAALRRVLGTHVTQAGSLVEPDRLRFDFTHGKPLSPAELREIEDLVNLEIARGQGVVTRLMPIKEALASGAMAMFGEKYGDQVRVIRMGDFSTELCGGTHVTNTALIRLFKILSEGGVSSGVRRIEALTSDDAVRFVLGNTRENLEARSKAGVQPGLGLTDWIDQQRATIKSLEKQIQALQKQGLDIDGLVAGAEAFRGGASRWLLAPVAVEDRQVLRELADQLRDKIGSGAVVLIGDSGSSHPVLVSLSADLVGKLKAGEILQQVAGLLGGKGGGRPDFAQGAVPRREPLDAVRAALSEKFLGVPGPVS